MPYLLSRCVYPTKKGLPGSIFAYHVSLEAFEDRSVRSGRVLLALHSLEPGLGIQHFLCLDLLLEKFYSPR